MASSTLRVLLFAVLFFPLWAHAEDEVEFERHPSLPANWVEVHPDGKTENLSGHLVLTNAELWPSRFMRLITIGGWAAHTAVFANMGLDKAWIIGLIGGTITTAILQSQRMWFEARRDFQFLDSQGRLIRRLGIKKNVARDYPSLLPALLLEPLPLKSDVFDQRTVNGLVILAKPNKVTIKADTDRGPIDINDLTPKRALIKHCLRAFFFLNSIR